jgi:putative membrane-bound dehydrogenase-like protein
LTNPSSFFIFLPHSLQKSITMKAIKRRLLISHTYLSYIVFIIAIMAVLVSCNGDNDPPVSSNSKDSLTEEQLHLPENALKSLVVAEGLQVEVMATEPMLKNPTNIDVDEKGRVWVTEAYNYRPGINGNPTNELGDRIMILEDTNGDGKMDTGKVFYQGPELNAPLGVCVLGNKVLISQSPYVWAFYDDNGDDKADRKEIVFQGIGGEQHDHGVHSFHFGPDGKLYFSFGNEGQTLKDKNGKTVLDQDGDEIGPKKYKQGMLFRCNPDASNVECLGDNFRNNYEAAVDSYGTIWQSDNDDDGNRATRINYIMQRGNYGFRDEVTDAGWQSNRTNIEDSIPIQHWHLNDPGVVPNLLQTGAGSPTGMIVYEGSLLPQPFQNQIIHCDPGPNVIRAYPLKKNGAGYTAEILNLVKNERDQWFRPADVCMAPDGSLIIADWYDPGVGGHAAGDQQRGRIYRLAPKNSKYKIPVFDYSTPAGAIAALQNPNLAIRYHAWTALDSMGEQAVPELEKLWRSSPNPRMRARAFWVLVKMPGREKALIQEAIKEGNPELRMMGIRAATQLNSDVTGVVRQLVNDPDVQVLRECALALHHVKAPDAADLWSSLASKHDGKDRWYLEALGIGADNQWDKYLASYLLKVTDPLQTDASRDIVWRARSEKAVPYIAQLASQQDVDLKQRLRYFRAFDFNSGPAKSKLLLNMIVNNTNKDTALNKLVLRHLDVKTVRQSPVATNAMKEVIKSLNGTPEYIEMVKKYEVRAENPNLLNLAITESGKPIGRNAAGLLLQLGGRDLAWKIIKGSDTAQTNRLLASLGGVGSKESLGMLQSITLSSKYPIELRKQAATRIGRSGNGEERVLELLKARKVPTDLIPPIVESVSRAWRGSVRAEAATYLPGATTVAVKKEPTMKEVLALTPKVANGKAVFSRICALCHQVGNEGFSFGPPLTEIGSKLPKESQLEAILHPSAGISFGYEGWELNLKDGSKLTGIISSKTESDIELKLPGGNKQSVKASDVQSMKKLPESMMPDGLEQTMSTQELSDLLEYLDQLKKKQ